MGDSFDVPVVLFVFNRPDFVRTLMARLAEVRPAQLLVVADGPRHGHPTDAERCAESRRLATAVTWPAEVSTEFADENLGCDRRLLSGLDRAFDRFDRAVILEDDVLPHPSFFGWVQRMLDRYADHERIEMVSGRNMLARWDTGGADHFLARWGSVYGWASWSDRWRGLPTSVPVDAQYMLDALGLDEVQHTYASALVEMVALGGDTAWDALRGLSWTLAGRCCVVPSVNLVANVGFGHDATRTMAATHFAAQVPVGPAPAPSGEDVDPPTAIATRYDRWALLTDLVGGYLQPDTVVRVAQRRTLLAGHLPVPAGLSARGAEAQAVWRRVHLLPVDHAAETVAAIDHLRAAGVHNDVLDRTSAALRERVLA